MEEQKSVEKRINKLYEIVSNLDNEDGNVEGLGFIEESAQVEKKRSVKAAIFHSLFFLFLLLAITLISISNGFIKNLFELVFFWTVVSLIGIPVYKKFTKK